MVRYLLNFLGAGFCELTRLMAVVAGGIYSFNALAGL